MCKVCVDRYLPIESQEKARAIAIAENPDNLKTKPLIDVTSRDIDLGSVKERLAVLVDYKWKVGRTLNIYLHPVTDPVIHEKLKYYALKWTKYANIKFNFVDDPNAEIRISFEKGGSWSYMGTINLMVEAPKPTMNFGWLYPDTSDEEYSRVVLHEFGHMLGCIHEHMHPELEIPWDKEKVYEHYAGSPNFWTKEQVDHNLFQKYSKDETQFSTPDTSSIMMYPVPKEHTIGGFEVGWNKVLTEQDKAFIGKVYPFDKSKLKLVSLECLEAPSDEACYIYVGSNNVYSGDLKAGGKVNLGRLPAITFEKRASIRVYDQPQEGVFNQDDHCGTVFAHERQRNEPEITYFQGIDTLYRLTYEVA